MNSTDEILTFIRTHVSSKTTCQEITTLMNRQGRDSAWIYLGGTGARQQIFLLEENFKAVFQFDGDDQLVAYGAYHSTVPWNKDERGNLVSGSDSNVPLVLLGEETP